MKVLAVIGSPRKQGDNAQIVRALVESAEQKGHQIRTVFVYDMNFKGCTACDACKDGRVEFCAQDDDFTRLVPEIVGSDCILLASPIYMGHITGEMKTFIDRWCCFFDDEFEVHHVMGKKIVLVTTSAAPAAQFSSVSKYMKDMFGGFFKMTPVGQIHAGGLYGPDHAASLAEAMESARAIGASL